jgi:hypothetical protein
MSVEMMSDRTPSGTEEGQTIHVHDIPSEASTVCWQLVC